MSTACDLCQLLDGYANKQGLETLLWRSERLCVVAVDDPSYPGFCRVIWNKHVKEMTDHAGRAQLRHGSRVASRAGRA